MRDNGRLFDLIRSATGLDVSENSDLIAVGGGDIHASYRLETNRGPLFLKLNDADSLAMFAAEAEGLAAIRQTDAIRVPEVIAYAGDDQLSFLLLEWLEMSSGGPREDRDLGRGLARLHRCRGEAHGWPSDNFIGSTPQINTPSDDWTDFYRDCRLRPQFEMAARNGFVNPLQEIGEKLCDHLGRLLGSYQPPSSLLHGDLWGGNKAALADGTPVIFDPAAYYGDRETDLAMTRLFGGFSESFYSAYEDEWPLEEGTGTRCRLYQLYHLLNHLNMFGASYLNRAEATANSLLKAV
ncbi:MAG: fructosamine kinase family protein [Gammaproteobacteria bacterium]|nr:fructosamine kinase family protein [Gammaproteobacteria bacterium]